jgi:hypothetical protein
VRTSPLFAAVTTAVGLLVFGTVGSQASTSTVDLAISGSVVAGVTGAQPGQHIPFVFTMANRSSATADVAFTFTLSHARASGSDYVCPTVSGHFDINPDTPSCEPGFLTGGHSTSAAIIITPTITTGTVSVRACASNLSGTADPVSSNNCKTLSIRI